LVRDNSDEVGGATLFGDRRQYAYVFGAFGKQPVDGVAEDFACGII
jgi:hypothetical protein